MNKIYGRVGDSEHHRFAAVGVAVGPAVADEDIVVSNNNNNNNLNMLVCGLSRRHKNKISNLNFVSPPASTRRNVHSRQLTWAGTFIFAVFT